MDGTANPFSNPVLYTLTVTWPDGKSTNLYSSYDRGACVRRMKILVMRKDYAETDLKIWPDRTTWPNTPVFEVEFGEGYYGEDD